MSRKVTAKYVVQHLRTSQTDKPLLARIKKISLLLKPNKNGMYAKQDIIQQRIQYLNETLKINPSKILILGNKKSALNYMNQEMPILTNTNTIFNYVNQNIVPIVKKTFHTEEDHVVNKNSTTLQYNTDLKILPFNEMVNILNQNVYELPIKDQYRPSGNPTYHVKSLLNFFKTLEENDINAKTYDDYISNKLNVSINCTNEYFEAQVHLSKIYQIYEQDICKKSNICTNMKYFTLILEYLKENNNDIQDQIFKHHHVNKLNPYVIIPNFEEWTHVEQQLYNYSFHPLVTRLHTHTDLNETTVSTSGKNNIDSLILYQEDYINEEEIATKEDDNNSNNIDQIYKDVLITFDTDKTEDVASSSVEDSFENVYDDVKEKKLETESVQTLEKIKANLNHSLYSNNNDEIIDMYNKIQDLFLKEKKDPNTPLKIAIILNRVNDEKQLRKHFNMKNNKLDSNINGDNTNKIEVMHHGRTNVPLYHDACIRALAGYLDIIKDTSSDSQSLINVLIAFPEIEFEAISIALKASRDIDMPLEDIIRNDRKFHDLMQHIDHGRNVYKEYLRKRKKDNNNYNSTINNKEQMGYERRQKNELVINLLKEFMNDRGWKEDVLTEKHVNNIDNFLTKVVLRKYSTILLNDSPTSYAEHAHNLDQNMNYKYNTLDPHETSIVDLYRKHDFLTTQHEIKEYDHIFIPGFAMKRGYPETSFRSAFRIPSIFVNNSISSNAAIDYEYIDVPNEETNLYCTKETLKMRKKRLTTIQERQFEEFVNKILMNNNIKQVHTSNASLYTGLKTEQEPSKWLQQVHDVTIADNSSTSYESYLVPKKNTTDLFSAPSYNNVKQHIDLFQIFFQKPKKTKQMIDVDKELILRDNNYSTWAGDFLPLHDGEKMTQQLLNYGSNVQKHMSHAQVQKYKNCPKEYMYRYVLNIPEDTPTPLMIYGSVMHDTMERFWELRSKHVNNPISLNEISDICVNLFKSNWRSESKRSKHLLLKGQTEILEEQGVGGLMSFIERYYDAPLPLNVEKQFELPIPGYPSKYFRGTIDLIDHVGNIVEFKSNKLSTTAGVNAIKRMAGNSLQPRLYALTLDNSTKNVYMEGVENGERVLVETKGEQNDSMNEVTKVLKKIEDGNFPAKPGHFTCNFCSYKRLCTEHSLKEIA